MDASNVKKKPLLFRRVKIDCLVTTFLHPALTEMKEKYKKNLRRGKKKRRGAEYISKKAVNTRSGEKQN